MHLDRGPAALRRELVLHRLADGIGVRATRVTTKRRGRRADRRRHVEFERPEGLVDEVRTHVADGADTEVHPAAPREWMIGGIVRHEGRGTDEEVPVQPVGHRRCDGWRRARDALRPVAVRAVRPDVHLADRPEHAARDHFLDLARAVRRMALVAHLRHDLRVRGGFLHRARFHHRVRQRLLHINMLLRLHCTQRNHGVHVIGRRDHDGIDVLLLVEHLTIVRILHGLRVRLLDLLPGRQIRLRGCCPTRDPRRGIGG